MIFFFLLVFLTIELNNYGIKMYDILYNIIIIFFFNNMRVNKLFEFEFLIYFTRN